MRSSPQKQQPDLKKSTKAVVGSGRVTSFGQIEGATNIPFDPVTGRRVEDTTSTVVHNTVSPCGLPRKYGKGLAGGSQDVFEQRRKDSMQRKDYGAPKDAQADELPNVEGDQRPDQSYTQKPRRT